MLVYNEQDERFSVGEQVFYNGLPYIIKQIIFPSKSEAKYTMQIVLDYDSPHYCRVYEKEIGDALCYETICGLQGVLSSSAVPELNPFTHLEPLRVKCRSCPYSDLGAETENLAQNLL